MVVSRVDHPVRPLRGERRKKFAGDERGQRAAAKAGKGNEYAASFWALCLVSSSSAAKGQTGRRKGRSYA